MIYPQKIKVTDKIVDVEQFYKMRKTNILPFLKEKKLAIDEHIKKIENSDAVLVLNFDKKGKRGYIGGNTFLEMAIAYYLKKKIFLWKNPENDLPYFEEVLPLNPIIINGDLSKIK